jgi:hypothetical protein
MALVGAIALSATIAGSAWAQSSGFKTISDPSGYQYAVPAAWTLDSTSGAAGSLASSADGSELAYVTVVPPSPAPTTESTAEVLQGVVDSAITNGHGEDNYRVTLPATATTVPGADAAESGAVAYNSGSLPTTSYVTVAVRGLQAYTLTVLLPQSADAADPSLAQSILASFQLTAA